MEALCLKHCFVDGCEIGNLPSGQFVLTMRLRIQMKERRHFYLKVIHEPDNPRHPHPLNVNDFFVIFLCPLILRRLKIRNMRLGTTGNKCNRTPGVIPKTVQEVLLAIFREVEQVYYNPQIGSWSLQQRREKRTRKSPGERRVATTHPEIIRTFQSLATRYWKYLVFSVCG